MPRKVNSMKVYLIEDDPITVALISRMLYKAHITCDYPKNISLDCLEEIARIQPDVLLIDKNLGNNLKANMVIDELKDKELIGNIPVLVMSSDKDLDEILYYLSTYALDYIVKPIIIDDFIARIKTAGLISAVLNKQDQVIKTLSEEK